MLTGGCGGRRCRGVGFPLPSGKSLHADSVVGKSPAAWKKFSLPSGKSLHADSIGGLGACDAIEAFPLPSGKSLHADSQGVKGLIKVELFPLPSGKSLMLTWLDWPSQVQLNLFPLPSGKSLHADGLRLAHMMASVSFHCPQANLFMLTYSLAVQSGHAAFPLPSGKSLHADEDTMDILTTPRTSFHCPQANLFMLTGCVCCEVQRILGFHCPQANLFMLTRARPSLRTNAPCFTLPSGKSLHADSSSARYILIQEVGAGLIKMSYSAMQDGAPIVFQPPALPPSRAQCPFGRLCG